MLKKMLITFEEKLLKMLNSPKGAFNVDAFINVVLGVFIFTALIGTIASQVTAGQQNLTGGASILLGLVTLLLVIAFIRNIMKHK